MNEGSAGTVGHGGDGLQPVTAADVAATVGGKLLGDGTVQLTGVAPLDRAGPESLSFFAHERYATWFSTTRAGAVLVSPQLAEAAGTPLTRIIVDKPTDAMVQLLARFHRAEPRRIGVHSSAVIGENVTLGENVTIDPLVVIADGVEIGDGCWIGAGATIGAYSRLGTNVRVHPNATVHQRVEIGDRAIINAGARIGREGFGFVPRDGGLTRIPHVGRCVLEHDVEVGANSCIDRGSVDDTIIGAGTKIDNLVHIAHNVRVGRMCFIIAQTGIAGSTRIGDGVQIGGQAGIAGHVSIGSRASVAAQAGVFGDVPAGETWSGYPARPHREQMRASAALYRVAKIIRPLESLVEDAKREGDT